MDIKKLLGKNIKNKRIKLGLTQEELAEKIGISAKSLSQIELGNNFVSAENLSSICKALNTSPKALFDFSDNNSNTNIDEIISKLSNNKQLLSQVSQIINIIE